MTPCARSCCWTPFSCGTNYTCPCHWEDRKPAKELGDSYRHADPTARTAIRNVMKGKRK